MITIQHPVSLNSSYPLNRLGKLEELLFFDIETTGFSGEQDQLYLIGAIFWDKMESSWKLVQWFADTKEAEPECLEAFFALLNDHPAAVHFNGDTFDIPFLLKRCRHYGISQDFSQAKSMDIFRKIRPCRQLLAMNSMKQKAVEDFLGIHRIDQYSGGELIQVYARYLISPDPQLFQLLIQHNADDLTGMPAILPILCYRDMMDEKFSLSRQFLDSSSQHPVLTLEYETIPVPVPLHRQFPQGNFDLEGNRLLCRITLLQGELKYFYPKYKDYYYLPAEDMAVHKSVGAYVAKSARRQATAKTCYGKQTGLFLPQFQGLWTPVFRPEYASPQIYALYQPDMFQETEKADQYLRQILSLAQP